MSVRLFIRIPSVAPGSDGWEELEWALFRPNSERIVASVGSLDDINQVLEQNGLRDVDLYLLVPAQFVVSCHAAIPAKQTRFIQQALPYAVEENIAQDIDSMHLAVSRKSEKGQYHVLGVYREEMKFWFDFANGLGFNLKGIYPDALALPVADNQWSLCLEGDHAMLRSFGNECIRMPKQNLLNFLDLKFQQLGEPNETIQLRTFVYADEEDDNRVLLAELAQLSEIRVEKEVITISPFELLCESLQHQSELVNLCQGAFAVKSKSASPLKRWAPALGIAAAWFVIQVGINLGTGIYYQRQADQFSDQARSLYLNIFPNESRVSDIRRSLEGKLRSAQGSALGAGFLGLLTDAGYQLSQQPNRQAIRIQSLNFSRQRGELIVELQAGTFDQLDQFKQALVASGYNVEIGSAINDKDGVRSRINIRGG